MAPQTETKAGAGFKAGVKDYRLTYYTPDYQVKETDILAAFRMTPQPGVPPEEAGAADVMGRRRVRQAGRHQSQSVVRIDRERTGTVQPRDRRRKRHRHWRDKRRATP